MIRIRPGAEYRRRLAELREPFWAGGYQISPPVDARLRVRAAREFMLSAETDLALDLAENPLPARRFM
ncbi:MAG: hypothetical protein ACYCVZ_18010 [Streptosporangiaceae bacterium]